MPEDYILIIHDVVMEKLASAKEATTIKVDDI